MKAVLAANPRTIVVQMSAGPLTVPWLKANVPAMLQAWWSGEEGGHALADVLFGDVNPAGRLPHTVYASETQVPPQDEYDISQGFTYMYVKGEPLYAFGHGLSYTQFEYADLQASGTPLTVAATIKNTGTRARRRSRAALSRAATVRRRTSATDVARLPARELAARRIETGPLHRAG